MRRISLYLGTVLVLFVGFTLGVYTQGRDTGEQVSLQCRPSAPETLAGAPAVLVWGNSLAFDHGWQVPGHLVVNCARQGMTAEAAVPLTEALPRMPIEAVVLIFGTVELVRPAKPDAAFQAAMSTIRTRLQALYPEARLIVVGIPGAAEVWSYADRPELGALNEVLAGLGGTFLDVSETLAAVPGARRSYDGVHLTAESYGALEARLAEILR